MAYTFGQATLRDTPELVRLRVGYLTADFGELAEEDVTRLREELPTYLELHLDTDLFVFCARDETGAIVSCAWLLLVEKPPSPRFPHGQTGTLFNVFTVAEHRRHGLARAVMGQLVEASRELVLDVLELHATEDGYPLYRAIGFDDDSTTHVAMRMML